MSLGKYQNLVIMFVVVLVMAMSVPCTLHLITKSSLPILAKISTLAAFCYILAGTASGGIAYMYEKI